MCIRDSARAAQPRRAHERQPGRQINGSRRRYAVRPLERGHRGPGDRPEHPVGCYGVTVTPQEVLHTSDNRGHRIALVQVRPRFNVHYVQSS